MISSDFIPEFAILGHPNEGKSSVVSTLAEDDSVRIGPVPGETIKCQTFSVKIDGEEIIKFTDTPGFQCPKQTLAWMRNYSGPDELMLSAFIDHHRNDPEFRDECELFGPVAKGAGIIYVVDGSRPLRNDDRAEMEILRLTARPRMAVINCKDEDSSFLLKWKNEFRKHFNSIRLFNAKIATYTERMELLESLKSMDQDWQPALVKVIEAFKKDWLERTEISAAIIVQMLEEIIGLSVEKNIRNNETFNEIKEELGHIYRKKIESIEKKAQERIKKLFKHNIFHCELPSHSILNENLFSEKTWKFLGLSPGEMAIAAGIAGGTIGAAIDIAAAGITFGVFSAIGGLAGAGSALLGGRHISGMKIRGIRLGRDLIRVGPTNDIQLMYVLLDRAIIFYSAIINWAHARRDYSRDIDSELKKNLKKGTAAFRDENAKKICADFFSLSNGKNKGLYKDKKNDINLIMTDLVKKELLKLI